MQIDEKTINNSYIIQEKVDQNPLWEIWTTRSIYSPNTFLLCFLCLKESEIDQGDYTIFRHYFYRVFNIQHPCLYHPLDLDVYNDHIYIALESKEGIFLYQFLEEGVTIPFHVALQIIIDLLRGLQELKKLHISHNLLSPLNIWLNLTPEGIESAQICDYFLSPLTAYLLPILKKEEGFSCYLSPALLRSEQPSGSYINDIYSVGIILYRLLTGKCPAKVGTGKPAQFLKGRHDLPDGMEEVLLNMLDIKAVVTDINDLLNTLLEMHSCIKESEDDYMQGFDPSSYLGRVTADTAYYKNQQYLEELETVEEDMEPAASGISRNVLNRIKSFFRKRKKRKTGIPTSPEVESLTMRELSERKKTITLRTITGDMGFIKKKNSLRRLQKLFAALKAHYIYDKVTGKSLDMDRDARPRPKTPEKDMPIPQRDYKRIPLGSKNDMALPKEPLHSEKTGGDSFQGTPLDIPEWDSEFMNLDRKEQIKQSAAGADTDTPEIVTGMIGKPSIPPAAETREKEYPLDDEKRTQPSDAKKQESHAPPPQPSLPQQKGRSELKDRHGFFHRLLELLKKAFSLLRNIFLRK